MKKLVMAKGLPASGKSTWAKEFVNGKKDWVRVNNDDLQMMMFGAAFAKDRGDFLDKARRHLVDFFMNQHMNIVIDNTNLHPKQEQYYREIVALWNMQYHSTATPQYVFHIKDFTDVSVNECLKRNRERAHPIPDKVIYDMYNSYLKTEVPALKQDKTLPKAIVVDLDGTMSLITTRSPHDLTRVYEDNVNQPIVELVRIMQKTGHTIFFISGREQVAYEATVKWLADKAQFEVGSYYLFLRPNKDPRPDTQFKKDVFEQELKGKYYVDFWIEDRWRMTNAVRNELGITCLQCADGHF